jgi:cytochrome c5
MDSSTELISKPSDVDNKTTLRKRTRLLAATATTLLVVASAFGSQFFSFFDFNREVDSNADRMLREGKQTFRFDTFGDEAFWGDMLRLHQAIEGERFGGVGPGLTPRNALALGLKVDADELPRDLIRRLRQGRVNLDDPAVTLLLLRHNAILGVKGFFNEYHNLRSVGITCAFCHSTVDDSVIPGVGNRLDAWANRDLNVGEVIALAPDLSPFSTLLGLSQDEVRAVLRTWGPGKFDAELSLDGKAVNPQQISNGVVTGTNVPAATLIPPAFGLAGVNLHTWTGWGSVTHWNAFVANLEMHGSGTFFDPRLNDPAKFPIAVANGFANVRNTPDLITPKLAGLHFYQLAIPAPRPPHNSFNQAAARRGKTVFNERAQCDTCHVPPLFTEPGWNMHTPTQMCIDDFQAKRSPDEHYRTSPLKGLWTHQRGGFFHDGRFANLLQVVNHYNTCFSLGLSEAEKSDLVEYLKSL